MNLVKQSFTANHKLRKPSEFLLVFKSKKMYSGSFIKIHYNKCHNETECNNSRLGLIVSKRVHKRANKRNYMKRVLRELFRTNQIYWPSSYDIIIRVQKLFTHNEFISLQQEFLQLTKFAR